MKLGFFGPPGAGKGTEAALVSKKLGVPHISTGDMFRAAVQEGTATGLEAKAYMEKGELVPDAVTVRIVKERLEKPDCEGGFILDGFPRTIPQAEALDEIVHLDAIVNLMLSDDAVVHRLGGRRSCETHGIYHLDWLEGDKIHCPKCGEPLIKRADDEEETIRNRLHVYHEQTAPLIAYYQKQGIARDVDGSRSVEAVYEDILAVLGVTP